MLRLESYARDIACARFHAFSDDFFRQGVILLKIRFNTGNIQGMVFEYSSSRSWNLKIFPKKFVEQMM